MNKLVDTHIVKFGAPRDKLFANLLKEIGWSDDAINDWEEEQVQESNRVQAEEDASLPPSDRALAWHKSNPWYGDPSEMDKTRYAFSAHCYLSRNGVRCETDGYWALLDEFLSRWDSQPTNEQIIEWEWWKPQKKGCPVCGTTFIARRNTKKVCSATCRQRKKRALDKIKEQENERTS